MGGWKMRGFSWRTDEFGPELLKSISQCTMRVVRSWKNWKKKTSTSNGTHQ